MTGPPRRNLKSSESVPLVVDDFCGRMLIVDHKPEDRLALATHFLQRGWEVVCVADMKAAIDIAITMQPDAILTELALPGVTGFHFVRALRSAVDHDVVVVGIGSLATDVEAARSAVDRVFIRPVSATDLEAVLPGA